jgi:hypothetical protein
MDRDGGSTMLEVGKTYTITTWKCTEDGGMTTDHFGCIVTEVKFPVIKVRQHDREWIINMTCPAIAGAKLE